MRRRDLVVRLALEGVDAQRVSADGRLREDAWIIEGAGARWTAYYLDERGLSEGEISFGTEDEVCVYVLRTLVPGLRVGPGSDLDLRPRPLENPPPWVAPGYRWVEVDGLPTLVLVSDGLAQDWPHPWGELPEGKLVLREGSLIEVDDPSTAAAVVAGLPDATGQAREPRAGATRYMAWDHLLVACADPVVAVGSVIVLPTSVSQLRERWGATSGRWWSVPLNPW